MSRSDERKITSIQDRMLCQPGKRVVLLQALRMSQGLKNGNDCDGENNSDGK